MFVLERRTKSILLSKRSNPDHSKISRTGAISLDKLIYSFDLGITFLHTHVCKNERQSACLSFMALNAEVKFTYRTNILIINIERRTMGRTSIPFWWNVPYGYLRYWYSKQRQTDQGILSCQENQYVLHVCLETF